MLTVTNAKLHSPTDDISSSNGNVGAPLAGVLYMGAPGHAPGHAQDYVTIEIEDPDLCNRYTGMLIRDVRIGESPKWMQDRLLKAGMRPISNVVDITNYVMLEWGQPLHAFDYDLLVGRAEKAGISKPTIIVRRAKPGEKMTTLDGVEREFDDSMLLITDMLGPVA